MREGNQEPTSYIPYKQQRDPYNWYGRHEEILKLNKQSAPETVMIGNLITYFWGGEPIAYNQLGKGSWEKLFKGRSVCNLGFGWDKTRNVLWRIHHGELDSFQARDIFLLISTNNLSFNSGEEIIEGICRIARATHERQPQVKSCVMGILPGKRMEARIVGIDVKLQKQLVGKDCAYIDLAPQLTQEDGSIDSSLFHDGLHLNTEGYKWIVKVLKGYL